MENNTVNILIIGAGKGGTALIELFHKCSMVRILGVADIKVDAPGMKLAEELGIPTDSDYKKFLDKEGLNKIINVTGSEKVKEELLGLKPPNVELIGGYTARLMWSLIEERKGVEEALQKAYAQNEQLIASIPSIIIGIDGSNRVIQWNNAAEKTFGVAASGVIGRPFQECGVTWDQDRILNGILECRNQGRQRRVDNVPFKRSDGKEGFLGITINLLSGENNHGVLILGADITERKGLENQLIQAQKLESIGQLAAGVAHEINNPVGFINSNLRTLDEYRQDLTELFNSYLHLEELAAMNPALSHDQELAGTLETIRNLKEKMDIDFVLGDFDKVIAESREGTDRIKKIVQDLKDFSHVDQAELKWANLNKGLDSTLNIVWNELKYKAKVTKEYGDMPEIYCYPQQINQVFMNILVNAAQAIEDKGEIKISTTHLDGTEPMVEVRISDTGKGIPPENLSKIFDPFFTTKPVGKGTGLGLNVSYNIVKKHQGEIKVESEVGKGTTFIIKLPVEGPGEA